MKKLSSFIKKMLSALLGLALIIIGFQALWHFFQKFDSQRQYLLFSLISFLLALAFCQWIWRMKLLYVINHEGAHWLAAKLLFKKTGKFKISSESGSVEIHGSNMFTDLAPYVYPSTCLLICIPWLSSRIFWPDFPEYLNLGYLCIVSFFYGHHHYMNTRLLIKTRQQDLTKHGYWPSLLLICGLNTILLLLFFTFCDQRVQLSLPLLQKSWQQTYQLIMSFN